MRDPATPEPAPEERTEPIHLCPTRVTKDERLAVAAHVTVINELSDAATTIQRAHALFALDGDEESAAAMLDAYALVVGANRAAADWVERYFPGVVGFGPGGAR